MYPSSFEEKPTTKDLPSTSAFAAYFGQPAGDIEGQLPILELPVPITFRYAWRIHASRRRQGQEILHRDDDRFSPAAARIGDEGRGDFLRYRFVRQAQHLANVELLARCQVLFIPATDRIVVMGPGISDTVWFRIEVQAAGGPVLEVELDDFHPWQVQRIFQRTDVIRNDAQVFRDEAEPADFLIDCLEEVEAGTAQ